MTDTDLREQVRRYEVALTAIRRRHKQWSEGFPKDIESGHLRQHPETQCFADLDRAELLAIIDNALASPDPMLGTPADGRHPDHGDCGQRPCPHIPPASPDTGRDAGLDELYGRLFGCAASLVRVYRDNGRQTIAEHPYFLPDLAERVDALTARLTESPATPDAGEGIDPETLRGTTFEVHATPDAER